jgi:hypothetical protein
LNTTSDPTTNITQTHIGTGNNYGRDVYYSKSISSDDLKGPINKIMESLRHRLFDDAKKQIDILAKTSSTDNDTQIIFVALQCLLSLYMKDDTHFDRDNLVELEKNSKSTLYSDISTSVLMRLDCENQNITSASARYENLPTANRFATEAFLELVADAECIQQFASKLGMLGEIELCGLFRGSIRTNELSIELKVAEYLNESYPSRNSKIFLAIANSNNLFSQIKDTQYWYTRASTRRKILSICAEVENLVSETEGSDLRILNLAINLLNITLGDCTSLNDTCWKYISTIDSILPLFAESLRYSQEKDISKIPDSDFRNKILKAESDSEYRKLITESAAADSECSFDSAWTLKRYGNIDQIDELINRIINSADTHTWEKQFIRILLEVSAASKEKDRKADLGELVKSFSNEYRSDIGLINLVPLNWICERLISLNQSHLVCELLREIIPISDIWLSPLVDVYLYSLLHSDQLMTLSSLLNNVDDESKNADYWKLLSHHLEYQKQFNEAFIAIKNAVDLEPSNAGLWSHAINLLVQISDDEAEIKNELYKIPETAFKAISNAGFYLLSKMLPIGIESAEKHLLDWFLSNPNRCVIPITNIFLTNLNDEKKVHNFKFETERCPIAVEYTVDKVAKVAVITNDPVSRHPNIISTSTPLGKLLLTAEPETDQPMGLHDIRITQILPPIVGAFRIAMEIRSSRQDGTDCFYRMDMPEDDPEAMFKTLEKMLRRVNNSYDHIFSNPQIPIFMKGHFYRASSPITAALIQLTEKKSAKPNSFAIGESNPQHMILDGYAIIYLYLSGLLSGLLRDVKKIVITLETQQVIHKWMHEVNRENYLTLGITPKGGIYRTTAEDIRYQTRELQGQLVFLINNAQTLEPSLIDLPPEIISLKGVIDESVFSSIKLAISNDIPWLCIDSLFINMTGQLGYKYVNTSELYLTVAQKMTIAERKIGFLGNIESELPITLLLSDLYEMAKSSDDQFRWILAELLMVNAKNAPQENLNDFLSCIIVYSVLAANFDDNIRDGIRIFSPSYKGHTERIFNACCYTAISSKNALSPETRFVLLLREVLQQLQDFNNCYNLISSMANTFIEGYFLNADEIQRQWQKPREK